jgi:hypothetical protein
LRKDKVDDMANDIRSFGALMQSLEDGQLHADLSDKLHELNGKLVRHAESTGKAKGELVLKLKFNADNGGTVEIDCDLTIKEPKPARSRSVMWLTKESHLSAENPKQTKLPLREVAQPKAEEARSV